MTGVILFGLFAMATVIVVAGLLDRLLDFDELSARPDGDRWAGDRWGPDPT